MTVTVSINHTFEAGHRLRHIPGKCQSLHGHSWAVEVTVAVSETKSDGTIVMFGDLKREVRAWIDANLDHGMMLGVADPILKAIEGEGKTKVFRFGLGADVRFGGLTNQDLARDLEWPTVENVAQLIARASMQLLVRCDPHPDAYVARVASLVPRVTLEVVKKEAVGAGHTSGSARAEWEVLED